MTGFHRKMRALMKEGMSKEKAYSETKKHFSHKKRR